MRKLFMAFIMSLMTVSALANGVYIDQEGSNSTVYIEQDGTGLSFGTATTSVSLEGNYQDLTFKQIGTSNVFDILHAYGDNLTMSWQALDTDNLFKYRSGNSVSNSTVIAYANGTNNEVYQTFTGTSALSYSYIRAHLTGNYNIITQNMGVSGAKSDITATGNYNEVTTTQTGYSGTTANSGHSITVGITGSSNTVDITQSNTTQQNTVNLTINGSNNTHTITQTD